MHHDLIISQVQTVPLIIIHHQPLMLTRTIFLLSSVLLLTCCFHDMKNDGGIASKSQHKLFTKNCSSCHGTSAETFIAREWKYGNSRLDIIRAIKNGFPDGQMPAYGKTLKDKEILDLANYIIVAMESQKKQVIEAAAPRENKFMADGVKYHLDTIATDLENPWGIAFLPGGDMLFTERSGKLWRLNAKKQKTEISGVPATLVESQGGLLDVALHPRFAENQFVYLTYSKFKDSADVKLSTTAVFRAKLVGNALVDGADILVALPYTTTRYHYGSRMAFDKNGYLFVSVGERGQQDEMPQFLNKGCGKIHRIYDDGRIPTDNPFTNAPSAVGSIWSYGHRNPQGLTVHPVTGEIWETEHGPRGGDELNWIQKGKNYGWPLVSYGTHYDGRSFTESNKKDGVENPLNYWVPSIAPCGMTFITGDRYKGWKGDLLVGSLRFKYVTKLKLDGKKVVSQEALIPNAGRVRCVVQGPDGYIYVAAEEPGFIFRVVPD